MKKRTQHTLKKNFHRTGVGVHMGVQAKLTVHPAPENTGIVFVRGGEEIPLLATAVTDTTLCTKLSNAEGTSVQTVEHLLAALHAMGVDNARVEIDGPEVPILDGSSLPWVEGIQKVGLARQWAEQQALVVTQKHSITLPSGTATVEPYDGLYIEIEVTFPLLGTLRGGWEITPEIFAKELAPARTFCLQRDVEKLKSIGLLQGGSLACAVVFDDNGQPINPEGLRFPDEPLRHKVLDAVGDLFMAGKAVRGKFFIPKPGHGNNNLLLRQLLTLG
ncbi:MAG: UDP-3-O-acyl-N-acetylglucosamine deacetylase [Alphaproteobacteria bacterium]